MSDVIDPPASAPEPEKNSSNTSTEFEKSAQQQTENIKDDVPEMVKEDQPKHIMKPTLEGTEAVDQDHFDAKWDAQTEKHAQKEKEPDAFDKIDQEKEWADRLRTEKDKGKER